MSDVVGLNELHVRIRGKRIERGLQSLRRGERNVRHIHGLEMAEQAGAVSRKSEVSIPLGRLGPELDNQFVTDRSLGIRALRGRKGKPQRDRSA